MTAGFSIAAVIVAAQLFVLLEAVPIGRRAEDNSSVVNDQINDDIFISNSTVDMHGKQGLGTYEENKIISFEGDIVISIEELHKYYDFDEEMERELQLMFGHVSNINKRAATSYQGYLWTNWTIPYEINISFNSGNRQKIINAMNVLSSVTCLNFVERTTEYDYVHIRSGYDCSSYVGHIGGLQYLNLTTNCRTHGIILHELGHALGLWHEQSRPDRDSYVTIHLDNIEEKYRHNFRKRMDRAVDYQGTRYDYGSVMHYGTKYYTSCSNCNTITVANETEYEKQGRPRLGQRIGLSPSDIIQINRLYKCPGPGQQGLLMFYIRYGHNISTKAYGTSDPYVSIKAISSNGSEYIKESATKRDSRNPTWNEELFFPETEWQFFKIRVWDLRDNNEYDPRAMSVTVPLLDKPRTSNMNKYCINTACSGYIMYDYKLLGIVYGRLEVRLRETPSGEKISLAESGSRQPTVTVTTISPDGSSSSYTLTKSNRWVTIRGCSFAEKITVDIEGAAVQTNGPQFIQISPGLHTYCLPDVSFLCRAYAPQRLDVRLIPDGDECQPNPCLNGGTCTDGCATYSCSCPDSFIGNQCQKRI